jgi:hypothetical protein
MLVSQKDAIMKITGIITPKSIDTLEIELGGAFTIVKSTHRRTALRLPCQRDTPGKVPGSH